MLFTDAPIDLPGDIGRWRFSFVPIAVRQSVPLWRVANLPAPVCDRPDNLIAIARTFIDRLDSISRDLHLQHSEERGWIDDAYVERARGILHDAARELAVTFGPGPAGELMLWFGRNEVNWAVQNRWWGWWLLLSGLARGQRTLPDTLLDRDTQVQLVARSLLDSTIEKALEGAEREALLISLDSLEERLVKYDIGTLAADIEYSSQDVVVQMKLAAERERAFLAHRLLSMALPVEDIDTLERLAVNELGR